VSLIVLEPGLQSRLVDCGRLRTRSLGVPIGGAADLWSLAVGNGLVGNTATCCALEVSLKGPVLRAEADIGAVLFGAPFQIRTTRRPLAAGHTFQLRAGEELTIGGTPAGMRAYLCVAGGFDAPAILDSRSSLGPIAQGQRLACASSRVPLRSLGPDVSYPSGTAIEVVPGLQASWFDEREFYGQEYVVTPAGNRMGLRLQGRPLTMPAREMVSEPVAPGAVQVTRDGQCIVLGVDGQTIGGYPKIAHVIRADLDLLGQLRPGTSVRFVPTTLAAARDKYERRARDLQQWMTRLLVSFRVPDQ
jgi:antagonist of KipI